jgi:hypothetical protein
VKRALAAALLLTSCSRDEAPRFTPRTWPEPPPFELPDGFELVYAQDFASEAALEDFAFSDPSEWRRAPRPDGTGVLELTGTGAYEPPHRSPHRIALVDDLLVGDFVLEVLARYRGREYGHQDLCVFFGFESPSRFYYVHLAPEPDEHAHNVFLVHDAERRALAPVQAEGVKWGPPWHSVRVERIGARVRVYFSGEPVLEVQDDTLGFGRVGVGSFDDQGEFWKLRVFAPERRAPSSPAF